MKKKIYLAMAGLCIATHLSANLMMHMGRAIRNNTLRQTAQQLALGNRDPLGTTRLNLHGQRVSSRASAPFNGLQKSLIHTHSHKKSYNSYYFKHPLLLGLAVGGISSYALYQWHYDNEPSAPQRVDAQDFFKHYLHDNLQESEDNIVQATQNYCAELNTLYAMPAAPGRRETLKEHTTDVLVRYHLIKPLFDFSKCQVEHITENIDTLFHAIILLHDIGKPLGDPKTQHERTIQIARPMLEQWGFNQQEISLAITLIDNDIIGEMVQNKYNVNAEQAYTELKKLARKAGVDLETFYRLQALLYLSDASSYPWIRKRCMHKGTSGIVYPNNPKFKLLHKLILGTKRVSFN